MKNTRSKYKLYTLIALALSIVSAAIRTVLLLGYFDTEINYYAAGTSLPVIHTVLSCAALIFFASVLLAFKKDELGSKKFHSSGIFIFSSALCGFTLALGAAFSLIGKDAHLLEKIASYTAVFAALYFLSMFINKDGIKKFRTLFGFFVPIWGTLSLAVIYFDSYVAINDPNKIIEQMAFVSVMLFFLYECRVLLETERPRAHLFTGFTAMFFTLTASLPGIVAFSLGAIDGKYVMYDVIFAAIFIYTCVRMFTYTKKD